MTNNTQLMQTRVPRANKSRAKRLAAERGLSEAAWLRELVMLATSAGDGRTGREFGKPVKERGER